MADQRYLKLTVTPKVSETIDAAHLRFMSATEQKISKIDFIAMMVDYFAKNEVELAAQFLSSAEREKMIA